MKNLLLAIAIVLLMVVIGTAIYFVSYFLRCYSLTAWLIAFGLFLVGAVCFVYHILKVTK